MPPLLRRIFIAAFGLVAVVWFSGLVIWIRKDGSFSEDLPGIMQHPAETHDLASYKYPVHIDASSYANNAERAEHPSFAIDDRDFGYPWGPFDSDPNPRYALTFPSPHDVDTVRLQATRSHGTYSIECKLEDGKSVSYSASFSTAAELPGCTKVRTLTFAFHRAPKPDTIPFRVYEMEVQGR